MKHLKLYTFAFICLLCLSCKPLTTKNETILRADSCMFSAPDKAFRILSNMHHPEKLSIEDYAAWCLNYSHARYKMKIEIKSDSTILIAVNYYRNSRLKKQSGTSLYLLGCIDKNLNKKKEAMESFKMAGDILKETNEENIKGFVYFNIGCLYIQDDLFNESLQYFKKSLVSFKRSNDKRYQAYAFRAIADACNHLNFPFKKIIYNTDLAIKLSKEAGDSVNYFMNISRKGELLYNRDYLNSKELLLQGFKFLPLQRPEYAAFLSFIYSKLNRWDSAEYYLKVAQEDKLNANKTLICLVKAYISKAVGNNNQAFLDLEKAYTVRDSISQQSILNQLYRIDKQYDLNKEEAENASLKIDNRNKLIAISLLIILVLLAVVITMVRYKII